LAATRKDLVDTAEKLTKTHKHSHEVEIELGEGIEKSATLAEQLSVKEELLTRKTGDLEDLEKRLVEAFRRQEETDTRR